MRRPLVFLIIFSMIMASSYYSPVGAASSVSSVLTLNLNVTVVNTAPFPKFLVLNPSYVVTVYRLNNNETTPELVSNPKLQLNGNPGIWLMPYETVVINLVSVHTQTYSLPQVSCGGEGDGSNLACGSVVPPFVNSPYSLSLREQSSLSLMGTLKYWIMRAESS